MFLIYVDESGTFEKADISENFVLAGFIISEHDWRKLDDSLKEAKVKHFPELEDIEIHTADIIHGKGEFQGKDILKRIKLLEEITNIIEQSEIKVFCVVMKKNNIFTSNIVFNMAYELLYERIAWNISHLNKGLIDAGEPPQYAIIFMDGRDEGRMLRQIRNKVRNLILKGSDYDHSKMIIEDPIFSNSKWRGNIQLADTLAYAFNYENKKKKNNHKGLHDTIDKIFKIAIKKMIKSNTDFPAYCYKIWPKKEESGR